MADEQVDTAAAVDTAKAQLEAAEKAHAAAEADKLANRTPEELQLDFFEAVTMRLGNRPELRAIVDQLKKHDEK